MEIYTQDPQKLTPGKYELTTEQLKALKSNGDLESQILQNRFELYKIGVLRVKDNHYAFFRSSQAESALAELVNKYRFSHFDVEIAYTPIKAAGHVFDKERIYSTLSHNLFKKSIQLYTKD